MTAHIKETQQVPCALYDWSGLLSGSKIVHFCHSKFLICYFRFCVFDSGQLEVVSEIAAFILWSHF